MEVKIKQAQQLLYKYITLKKPFFLHGTMGIGKSDSVRQVARKIAKEQNLKYVEGEWDEKNYTLYDLRATQMDPSDLRGIPFPEGKTTRWLIPNWLPTKGQGVIFIDEINLSPPSIQAAFYQLILERRIGDYKLPDSISIVAAGNRSIDKANVFPLSAPLKNRFSHATLLVPSDEEWREWAMDNGISTDIISFLAFKPQLLFKFDSNNKSDAFCTPRTWALASHMTKDLKGKSNAELEEIFITVATCVGEGAALEYQGFMKLKKQININDVLKNPKIVEEITDPGLRYSLISGLAEKYRSERKLLDPILATEKHMSEEFSIFLLRLLKGFGKRYFMEDVVNCKNWNPVYERVGKYIRT